MLKKALKIVAIVLAAAIVLIQFVRIDKSNPVVVREETLESSTRVPPDIGEILGRSCSDCHTNQTVYPWYSNVQPMAWFLKDHIDHGRSHLNFSASASFKHHPYGAQRFPAP